MKVIDEIADAQVSYIKETLYTPNSIELTTEYTFKI